MSTAIPIQGSRSCDGIVLHRYDESLGAHAKFYIPIANLPTSLTTLFAEYPVPSRQPG